MRQRNTTNTRRKSFVGMRVKGARIKYPRRKVVKQREREERRHECALRLGLISELIENLT